MSFTIFLQSFENGDVSTFERSIAWNIFGTKAVPIPMSWGLMYDGVPCGELSISDDEFIGGVSVSRPGDPAILDLYRLAQLVPSTINWDGLFVVADPKVIPGLPDWLVKALPTPPVVAHSSDELLYYMAHGAPPTCNDNAKSGPAERR